MAIEYLQVPDSFTGPGDMAMLRMTQVFVS